VGWSSVTSLVAATSRTAPFFLVALLVACNQPAVEPTTTTVPTTTTTDAVITTTLAPTTTSVAVTTTRPTTTSPPSAEFTVVITGVDQATLAHSWHEGCPVGTEDLAMITMPYWGFDDRSHQGRMVVHRSWTNEMVEVFGGLYRARYPIQSMIPIGDLSVGAEDQPGYSNTSGFHCRFVAGTTRWSQHAFGAAVDMNPHLNPLVDGDYIWPIGAERYADRTLGEPGMIISGDSVVGAFASVGWGWGGNFNSFKDYHHFSSTGT